MGKVSFSALIITGVYWLGCLTKYCFNISNKEFPERGRVQGTVIMVFALVVKVIGSVLTI